MRFLRLGAVAALLASACASVGVPLAVPQDARIIGETMIACEVPFIPSLHYRWLDTDGDESAAEWVVIAMLDEAMTVLAVVEGRFPDGDPNWTVTHAHVRVGPVYQHYDTRAAFTEAWPTPCDLYRANTPAVKAQA